MLMRGRACSPHLRHDRNTFDVVHAIRELRTIVSATTCSGRGLKSSTCAVDRMPDAQMPPLCTDAMPLCSERLIARGIHVVVPASEMDTQAIGVANMACLRVFVFIHVRLQALRGAGGVVHGLATRLWVHCD